MDRAIERMFEIFKQMTGQAEIADDLRHGAEDHVRGLFESGETDEQRLTVSGLTYLKKASAVDA
ncbi:MAG: hypothetical protein J0I29_10950 [Rhizobiales bacterium]|nr:hypothetical protein [Hyphomicrobiales bacterium]